MMNENDITVLGLGGAGVRAVGAVHGAGGGAFRCLAVDTDEQALANCPLPKERQLLAASAWRAGRGCGGSLIDGHRALARERARLESLLTGSRMLLVLGGLGGGTASGGAGVVLSICRKLEIPAVFLFTLPFTLEGHSRRKTAEEVLRDDLQEMADAVVTLPNDLLFSLLPATTPLAKAFELADRELAGAALGIVSIFGGGNLLSADFADLVAAVRRRKNFCSIGVGAATAEEAGAAGQGCGNLALERMMESPLLGGVEKIREADVVFLSLLGGPELGLGEARQLLEHTVSFASPAAKILSGVATREELDGRMQLAVLTVKYDVMDEPEPAREHPPRHARTVRKPKTKDEVEQLSFSLDMMSKGVMDKTVPVIFQGEDLDFPTFQRRNVAIDAGRSVAAADLKKNNQ